MDVESRQKTIIFLTGPVKEVEGQLAALPGEWVAVDFWHHVIREEPCVTVRLMPAALMRQMALMDKRLQMAPRMQ